jgi:type I restriction enzyme S subunit
MENIKPYKKHKPSGIAWLGDLPEHWEVSKLKYLANCFPSNVDKHIREDEKRIRLCNYTDVYKNDFIINKMNFMIASASKQQIQKFTLLKGDVIITKDSETSNDIAVPAFVAEDLTDVICGYHLSVIRSNNDVNGKYLFRLFQHKKFNSQFEINSNGVTRVGLGVYDLINAIGIKPTYSEQTAIANFLDYKTAKIDRFISKKKQLIKLLNEQKVGIINHAVTKGLDPNATMKDSGIKWLGDIPEHWEVVKLNGVCSFVRGNSSFKKDELLSTGKYVALQYGKTYKVNEVDKKYQFYVNDEFYKVSQIVNYGDVIFISTSETIEDLGHSVFYNRSDLGLLGGEQIVLKPNNAIVNGKYLCYSSKIFAKELQKYATGVKVFRFNINDLKTIYTSVPPTQEQTAIVSHIEKETSKLNKTISTIEKEIALTQEYRTALIAEAVTGKIDVRTFVIPTVSPQEELYEELEEELDLVAEDTESFENE